MVLTLSLWLVWDLIVDVRVMELPTPKMNRDRMWVATQLPLFRAGLAVVTMQFLWAGCLHVMNRARINYEFMLDFGPRANTNAALATSAAARTLIFYLLSILLFTKALIGELPKNIVPGAFPVAMIVATFGSLLLPIHSGTSLFLSLGRVLAAPCFHVGAAPAPTRRPPAPPHRSRPRAPRPRLHLARPPCSPPRARPLFRRSTSSLCSLVTSSPPSLSRYKT